MDTSELWPIRKTLQPPIICVILGAVHKLRNRGSAPVLHYGTDGG